MTYDAAYNAIEDYKTRNGHYPHTMHISAEELAELQYDPEAVSRVKYTNRPCPPIPIDILEALLAPPATPKFKIRVLRKTLRRPVLLGPT